MHQHPLQHVLQLDIQGTPQRWITLQQAALHHATDTIAWVDGEASLRTLRGGNGRKANRTPDEAGMPLLYLPSVPSRFEDFRLEGRHIRADVHERLAARLPKGSRLS